MLLSSLQQLLEMSAFSMYTRFKTLMPSVNDALVHAVPSIQQTVLQFVNAVQLRLIHSLLDVTLYLVTGVWSRSLPFEGDSDSGYVGLLLGHK